jgi:hypothetical protein
LSEEGYSRVESAYQHFRKIWLDRSAAKGSQLGGFAGEYAAGMFDADWKSFDDIYLGLYALNLAGVEEHGEAATREHRGHPILLFRAILDLDFPKIDRKSDFYDTLISEFVVADVIKFRQAISRLIPYPTILQSASVGCVSLDFAVLAEETGQRDDIEEGLPSLSKKIIEEDHAWMTLARRFHGAFELLTA